MRGKMENGKWKIGKTASPGLKCASGFLPIAGALAGGDLHKEEPPAAVARQGRASVNYNIGNPGAYGIRNPSYCKPPGRVGLFWPAAFG